jgi:hypothetical protein
MGLLIVNDSIGENSLAAAAARGLAGRCFALLHSLVLRLLVTSTIKINAEA